jgi:hypothetical protein
LNKIGKSIISNLDNKLNSFNSDFGNGNGGNGNGSNGDFSTWYGKPVIPMDQWRKIANHAHYYSFPDSLNIMHMVNYFPDEYNDYLLAFGVDEEYDSVVTDWWMQYVELHQQILIWRYGQENFQKMLNEQEWQREKEAWDFHKSNMGHGNDYYGGCTSLQCVPTCEFYGKSTQNPEALQFLQQSGYRDKTLPVIQD